VIDALAEQVRKRDERLRGLPFPQEAIAAWNDQPGRTAADVLDLFADAVAAVRAQVIELERDL
jgi:hypothetical protein